MKEVQLKLQHYNKIESRLGKPLGKASFPSHLLKSRGSKRKKALAKHSFLLGTVSLD